MDSAIEPTGTLDADVQGDSVSLDASPRRANE
jgi:hypothetical protein